MTQEETPATAVIAGGGIVGLVLAMTLKRQLGIVAEIYEKAHEFADEVGESSVGVFIRYVVSPCVLGGII